MRRWLAMRRQRTAGGEADVAQLPSPVPREDCAVCDAPLVGRRRHFEF